MQYSLDILRSWINLIDENGWVGREQILGEEARSKVSSPTDLFWVDLSQHAVFPPIRSLRNLGRNTRPMATLQRCLWVLLRIFGV